MRLKAEKPELCKGFCASEDCESLKMLDISLKTW